MFENISYQKKLVALGVLFVLLFLVANKRSFRATKNAYDQMKDVESRLNYMETSSVNSGQLQSQMLLYDDLIGKQDVEPYLVQQSILDFANKFSGVNIVELAETHLSSTNGFEVITNQLMVEGDFQSLAEVVYEYEKQFKISSLVSVNFVKKKDHQRGKDKLRVQLIFQNYEKGI